MIYKVDPVYKFFHGKNAVLRLGDINSDRYPEIMLELEDSSSRYIKLVSFDPSDKKIKEQENYSMEVPNLKRASFFDLNEDGTLDFVVEVEQDNNHYINFFYNTFVNDAFFLKAIHLSQENNYATFDIGSKFVFVSTDLAGKRLINVSTHSIQNNTDYLNLPYSYTGVGRSNNYIENFRVILVNS